MKKILLILFLAVSGSCTTTGPSKPSATGKAGELLVVISSNKWNGDPGQEIRDIFSTPVPMLLTPEPMFDVVQVNEEKFVRLFETHRHILIADINPDFTNSTIELNRHLWSYPQMVIRIKASNDKEFIRVLQENAANLIDYYLETEMLRLENAYSRMINHQARSAVEDMFGFKMAIPEGYYVAVRGDDFMWLRRTGTKEDLDMGVLISTLPYEDPEVDFAPETIRSRRDSITRKYIPGQMPDSYMTTYPELDHLYNEVNFNGIYAIEARGLWRMEGDFMGGPFINYTLVDESTNRLIMLDGFVYAPDFDKRDYIRQLQAVIKSLELSGMEKAEQNNNPSEE